MRAVIQRSHAFNKGFKEGIHAQDQKMNQQDEEAKQAHKEAQQQKRVGKVDENLIFGRGKKNTANLFKENQQPLTLMTDEIGDAQLQ